MAAALGTGALGLVKENRGVGEWRWAGEWLVALVLFPAGRTGRSFEEGEFACGGACDGGFFVGFLGHVLWGGCGVCKKGEKRIG